jgi:hypothetical protein
MSITSRWMIDETLKWAARCGSVGIVRMVLDADRASDKALGEALCLALERKHTEIADMLDMYMEQQQ